MFLAAILRFYGIGWGLPQVYEEATPLMRAWEMWGWGPRKNLDLNPHFFNYPSLTLYIQFFGQGLLYLFMKLIGLVESTLDYRVLYVVEKTPFYLLGRSITTLFGIATIWMTYVLGRRTVGKGAALFAAFFLAINTVHISKCQVIEVDVPMAFFTMLTLYYAVRLLQNPAKRNYILAGLSLGVAVSTKYTGAFLVLPLMCAHILTRREAAQKSQSDATPRKQRTPWKRFYLALGMTLVALFATSPFIFLDASTFFQHFTLEQQHMEYGHFGLETTPTWLFYMHSLTNRLLGWPLLILSLSGFIYFVVVKRHGWALVLAAFLVPYGIAVLSWAMKADRYFLPLLPVTLLFSSAIFVECFRLRKLIQARPSRRIVLAAFAIVILVAPVLVKYPDHLQRLKPDTRTEAKKWIETKIPSGALFVVEHYGPQLFGSKNLWLLEPDVRKHILGQKTRPPIYAVQRIPLLQTKPERSAVYYDLSLYEIADFVLTSGAVRSRYLKEPSRFRSHVAFYDSLEVLLEKVYEFRPDGGTGPIVTIYKNPRQRIPFARRGSVQGPHVLKPSPSLEPRAEEFFYENLGLNYETFGYLEEALTSYELAFQYPIVKPAMHKNLVLGRTRCLMALGRSEEAVEFLRQAVESAPTRNAREFYRRARRQITSRANNTN